MDWPFHKRSSELYPWDLAYFEHLIAELGVFGVYDQPSPPDPARTRAQAIIKQFGDDRENLTRGNLLELEQILLSLQPTETLLQRAPVLRLRYREAVGDKQFAIYVPADLTKCDSSDEAIRKSLLADLKSLVSGLHWRYILSPLLDKVLTSLTTRVICFVCLYTFLWAVAISLTRFWLRLPFLAMFVTVVYAGIVGGYISSLRRMQSVSPDADSLLVIQAVQDGSYFLWLSPMLGAVFAVVLMLFFMSGLLGGTLFPTFSGVLNGETWPFLYHLLPVDSLAYAKLFLWCFIAGFAERFVPDLLDRIIQRAQNASQPPPSQAEISGNVRTPRPGNGSTGAGDAKTLPDAGTGKKHPLMPEPAPRNQTEKDKEESVAKEEPANADPAEPPFSREH